MSQQPNPPTQERKRQGGAHEMHRSRAELKPELVKYIERLLEKQGIEYYEKNVINQMLEFMHYYSQETINEAKLYKEYANRKHMDVNDLRLAIYSKSINSFTRPLAVGQLKMIAEEKNKTPFPQIGDSNYSSSNHILKMGSSTDHCLTNNNLQVYSEEIARNLEEKKAKVIAKLNQKSMEEQKQAQRVEQIKMKQSLDLSHEILGKRKAPEPHIKPESQIQITFDQTLISSEVNESNHQNYGMSQVEDREILKKEDTMFGNGNGQMNIQMMEEEDENEGFFERMKVNDQEMIGQEIKNDDSKNKMEDEEEDPDMQFFT